MPIIPFEAYEPDPRGILIYEIAQIIEKAMSDPEEIGVFEVADMIVREVEESQIIP